MIKTLQKIFHLLSLQGKKKLYWLMFSVLVMAVLDMVGIASIFPFLNVLSDPNIIQENSNLKWAYDQFNFTSTNAFLIALGLVAFVFLLMNNILRATITIALVSFTYTKRHILSKILLEKYLYESYAFFLNRNTSELTTYLVSEVARVITGVLLPVLQVIAKSLMALFIIVLLVIVDPIIASVVIVIIGGGYAAVYGFLRKSLSRIGTEMTKYSKIMYKSLSEAFGGIKDIKILNKEQIFIDEFAGSIKNTGDVYRLKFIIAQIPRYAFEVLIFGGMLCIITLITFTRENSQSIIPIIGLYAFAAYRLMPTLQQIYQDVTNIRSSLFALDVVYEDYITCTGKQAQHQENGCQTLPFLKSIELQNLTYKYPKAQKPVIENFNLTVHPNKTVGFVGGTGAGKTTLIDILLGLLVPQEGVITIDGVKLDENNLRMWQNNIGYVPQHIYLCDDTVARNIAFGVPDNDICIKTLERVAQLANIHDFVIKELPHGYKTEVGERGVRLSGGQRQRIGIARALYRNPSLLVFDEATSALDGITEDIILEAIHSLGHMKTIVMIAHRLSTVKECDVIYLLNEGRITDQGTYQELLTRNQEFRKMAKMHERDDDDRLISSFEDVPECK